VRSRGPNEGRFTFTSHEAGDHSICLSTNYTSGWFSSKHIKLYLDIVAGATKRDVEHDRTHVGEVAGKIRELNERLGGIRREQQYQREREAQFRDMSERTNSRAVWYTVVQILVLVATCTWQLRHLKVSKVLFFSSLLHRVIIYWRFFSDFSRSERCDSARLTTQWKVCVLWTRKLTYASTTRCTSASLCSWHAESWNISRCRPQRLKMQWTMLPPAPKPNPHLVPLNIISPITPFVSRLFHDALCSG